MALQLRYYRSGRTAGTYGRTRRRTGTGRKEGIRLDTVEVWGRPDYDKCVKAVLRSRRDETEEFSLINKYNAFVLGLSTDEADKTEYENYLKEVLAVKAMVRADLAAAGIDVGTTGN